MDLSFNNSTSRSARLRRELRNPSMITIMIIFIVTLIVVLAPFVPRWVETTRVSFQAMEKQKELNQMGMSSISVIIPSQISPWLATQTNVMLNAEGPLDWQIVSFQRGPCDEDNLSQLPEGKYAEAIVSACYNLNDIQQRYSGSCFRAATCEIPDIAREEITNTMDMVWEAFSDAGFVLPYDELEQVLP